MIYIKVPQGFFFVVQALTTDSSLSVTTCRGMGTSSVSSWILRPCGCVRFLLSVPVSTPNVLLGKRANPPRYWQTAVFPASLAFIASAIGGVSLREEKESSPTQATSGNDNTLAVRKSVHTGQSAVSRTADEHLAEPAAEEGTQPNAEGVTRPGGSLPSSKERVGEMTIVEALEPLCPSIESLSSPVDTARQVNFSSSTQASLRQQRQQQRRRQTREYLGGKGGVLAGRCLVVCPTGAEASVVVCISALVAFFPTPHVPACSSTASAKSGLQRPPSTPSSPNVAVVETHETEGGEAGLYLGGSKFSVLHRRDTAATASIVTKVQLRTRFLLVQQECPWARPPRRLMKQLNEYFLTPGEYSWWSLSYRLLEGSDSPVDGAT